MIPSYALAAAPVALEEGLTNTGALYLASLALAALAGLIARAIGGAL